MRRVWLTLIAVGLLANNQGICSLRGSLQIGKVLEQSDDVVVATSVQDPANPGLLKLLIARSIKGDMLTGSAVKVSLPIDSSSGTVINSVSMSSIGEKTGLWFIRQSDSAWFLIPLFTGTVLPSDFYIPVPSGDLASPFAYTADLDPRKKLGSELSAAAVSASTEPDISQLFKLGVMDDLGPDVLQPMFAQLAASPKAKLRSVGLAGQIKQSIPAAVTTLAAIEFGTLPVDAQDQISNAVCDYKYRYQWNIGAKFLTQP